MFAYVKGELEEKGNDFVVMDVQGVGYKIFMPQNSVQKVGERGEQIKVHTHYHVREDNISLYGFLEKEELKMFELLLSVSGIGAKSATAMLSEITPSSFALAVITNDVSKLVKIPGVGKKTAERIILELKDKLKTQEAIDQEDKTVSKIQMEDEKQLEVISALCVLGYQRREVEKVLQTVDLKELSLEDSIRKLLSIMGR